MGLDMYMDAKIYTSFYWSPGQDKANNLGSVSVTFEVGHWRKANAIHSWFVRECAGGEDDCTPIDVPLEKLEELLELCRKVLDTIEVVPGEVNVGTQFSGGVTTKLVRDGEVVAQPGVAAKLLPTASGFFFGSTDYDEHYIADVRRTISIVERAVALARSGYDIVYRASW